jgi:dienelactone hydrolase
MRPLLILVTCLFTAPVVAQPDKPDFIQLARTTVERLINGDLAALTATFNDKVRAALPEEKLRAMRAGVLSQFGALKNAGEPTVQAKGDIRIAIVPAEFEKARLDFQIGFNASGQIVALNMRPGASTTPFVDASYVDPKAFTERNLAVEAPGWPLPGTLTVPAGTGPFPAVVLVHGSGPHDRDATIGPNKPFRDLAHGLASRGVAVLRYDKRTRRYAGKIAAIPNFTVKDETVDDAVAAVALLRTTPGIDPQRVIVLGHSLGGMLAPRIAAAAPGTRGVILFAGNVNSLPQAIADQTRHMAMADDAISPDEQKQIDEALALVERVRTLKATDPPVTAVGASLPASYLVDLRDYDPPAAAQSLKMPMLILQGERDYQVTMEDFARWKAALGTRADVMMKSYPALNHLFIAGTGRSMPAEYMMTPGHVAEEVVRDTAEWILRMK